MLLSSDDVRNRGNMESFTQTCDFGGSYLYLLVVIPWWSFLRCSSAPLWMLLFIVISSELLKIRLFFNLIKMLKFSAVAKQQIQTRYDWLLHSSWLLNQHPDGRVVNGRQELLSKTSLSLLDRLMSKLDHFNNFFKTQTPQWQQKHNV